MSMGFLIAGAVFQTIGAMQSKSAAKRGARDQHALDLENIELEKKETGESIRRTEEVNAQTRGTAKAQIGASGFGSGSSLDSYLETIKQEQTSDIDWMRTSGASRADISGREADARQRNTVAQANARFIGAIGGALMSVGGAMGGPPAAATTTASSPGIFNARGGYIGGASSGVAQPATTSKFKW